jgi:SAM-dependent methyltransferase
VGSYVEGPFVGQPRKDNPEKAMRIHPQLRERVGRLLRKVGQIRPLVPLLYDPRVSRVLRRIPGASALYGYGWDRQHPFDRANGTDTSGVMELHTIRAHTDHPAMAHAGIYAGSQPSVIRRALDELPSLAGATFIDFGCGKGRPLLVAAERPFREVVGVDLSSELAAIARSNAAIVQARFPGRAPIRVVVGDAASHPLPSGDLVLFFYHPFGAPIFGRVLAALERALEAERRAIYVIYYNPVLGRLFDASPAFTRRWAAMLPCARDERGYGADADDAVIIWQGGDAPPPRGLADGRIVLSNSDTRAELLR